MAGAHPSPAGGAPAAAAPFRLPAWLLVAGFFVTAAGACFDSEFSFSKFDVQQAHLDFLQIWVGLLLLTDREGLLRRRIRPTLFMGALLAAYGLGLGFVAQRSRIDLLASWLRTMPAWYSWLASIWLAWPLLAPARDAEARAMPRPGPLFRLAAWALLFYSAFCLTSAVTSIEAHKSLRYYYEDRGLAIAAIFAWLRAARARPGLRLATGGWTARLLGALLLLSMLVGLTDLAAPPALRDRLVRAGLVYTEYAPASVALPPRRVEFPMRDFNRVAYLATIAMLAAFIASFSPGTGLPPSGEDRAESPAPQRRWSALGWRSLRRTLLRWSMIAAGVFVIVQSYTRSAVLAVLAGLAVWALLVSRRMLLWIAIAFFAVVLLISGPGRQHILTMFKPSTYAPTGMLNSVKARLLAWQYCEELIRQHPIYGMGYGYRISRELYMWHAWETNDQRLIQDIENNHELQHFHNIWFETGAESGLPAVAALALFCLARWGMLAQWFRRAGRLERRRVAAWAAMEIAIMVAGMSLYMLKANFGMLTFFVWACAMSEAEKGALTRPAA